MYHCPEPLIHPEAFLRKWLHPQLAWFAHLVHHLLGVTSLFGCLCQCRNCECLCYVNGMELSNDREMAVDDAAFIHCWGSVTPLAQALAQAAVSAQILFFALCCLGKIPGGRLGSNPCVERRTVRKHLVV